MAVVPEGATAESRLDHQLNLFRRGAPPGSVQDIHRRVAAQNLTEQFGGRCSPRYVSVRQASSCAADAKRPFCLEPGTSKLHLDKRSCRCRFRVEDVPVARPHKQVRWSRVQVPRFAARGGTMSCRNASGACEIIWTRRRQHQRQSDFIELRSRLSLSTLALHHHLAEKGLRLTKVIRQLHHITCFSRPPAKLNAVAQAKMSITHIKRTSRSEHNREGRVKMKDWRAT